MVCFIWKKIDMIANNEYSKIGLLEKHNYKNDTIIK